MASVPEWHDAGPKTSVHTDKQLRAMAAQAARDLRGRLLDYRIVISWARPFHTSVTLQTRVRMPDGTVRYHNTAI